MHDPENYRICWPAILAVFAVQMIVLIAVSIAVATTDVPRHRPRWQVIDHVTAK